MRGNIPIGRREIKAREKGLDKAGKDQQEEKKKNPIDSLKGINLHVEGSLRNNIRVQKYK